MHSIFFDQYEFSAGIILASTERILASKKDRMPGYIEEIGDIPKADANEKQIKDLLSHLKVFKEKEFADFFTPATILSATEKNLTL